MFQAELRRALRFVLGELAEIIVKAGGGTAVEARPERRFADRLAAGDRHAFVIVRARLTMWAWGSMYLMFMSG